MKKCLIVCVLFLAGFINSIVWANDSALTELNLQVEGRAAIVKNDIARARDAAVRDAQEKAILQTAARLLGEKVHDEKFQAVKSLLTGHADRYVKTYRIATEGSSSTEYVVGVEIVVAQVALQEELTHLGVLKPTDANRDLSVSLRVKGVKKYAEFNRLKTFLQSKPKIVKSMYPCSLEWQQMQCELVIVGTLQNFISELEKSGRYEVEVPVQTTDTKMIILKIKEDVK